MQQREYLEGLGYVKANDGARFRSMPTGELWVCPPEQKLEIDKYQMMLTRQAEYDVNAQAKKRMADVAHEFGGKVGISATVENQPLQLRRVNQGADE
jgi:hypothetical protein